MKLRCLIAVLIFTQKSMVLFDFKKNDTPDNWKIVNDLVMGGFSNSSIKKNKDGYGLFNGHVSLKNNGGFAMTQYDFETLETKSYSKFVLKVKGDEKTYQFRVKDKREDSHSYIAKFKTSNSWQTIEIPFSNMYPTYRGRLLDMDNYSGNQMEMVAFLIGNKQEEDFNLTIDTITLK